MADALARALPPASPTEVAEVVRRLGEAELAQRAALIYDLREQHAQQMSVLAPEAQAVQDVLVTTGHGGQRRPEVRRIMSSVHSFADVPIVPAVEDRATRRERRARAKRRQLLTFAAMGVILGLVIVGVLLAFSGTSSPTPAPEAGPPSAAISAPLAPVPVVDPPATTSAPARPRRRK